MELLGNASVNVNREIILPLFLSTIPICVATLPLGRCLMHECEILEQQVVDEDVG